MARIPIWRQVASEVVPVSSSNLLAIEYEEETRTLFVEFVKGPRYEYYNVPAPRIDEMLASKDSPGKYFYHNIRTHYQYARISD